MSRTNYTRTILAQLALGDFVAVATFGAGHTVHYRPRNGHDPRPWTDGAFRYSGRQLHTELAATAHA